ncbi:hypothetical protein SADUNF_Sadunf13G0002700 [Salix dunnii]|uniref:Uncharacterized protein n=1 Tax=Salix dunnii TaxID=1413687 RepID=A0A835JI23_9ROSI|nr:hypothetical protein SADUNF_Sadunf13G0002700 [Salix dunnii]
MHAGETAFVGTSSSVWLLRDFDGCAEVSALSTGMLKDVNPSVGEYDILLYLPSRARKRSSCEEIVGSSRQCKDSSFELDNLRFAKQYFSLNLSSLQNKSTADLYKTQSRQASEFQHLMKNGWDDDGELVELEAGLVEDVEPEEEGDASECGDDKLVSAAG